MWISPTTLSGTLLRLEPLESRHAPDLLAAADPELFRHTPQAPPEFTIAGFEQNIARVNSLPDVVALAIIHLPTGKAIGRSTFMDIQPQNRGVEIGRTWFARAHHGTRVNPELKFLMLRHAFEELSPTAIRVQFTTGGFNIHSQTAIAKLGAVKEGVLRKNRIVPGGPEHTSEKILRDTVYFSILADEWPRVKTGLQQRLSAS